MNKNTLSEKTRPNPTRHFWVRLEQMKTKGQASVKRKEVEPVVTAPLKEILEVSRTFERWIEFHDANVGRKTAQQAFFAKALALAAKPVHLVQLYFRASGDEENKMFRKLGRMRASPKEWREASDAVGGGPLVPLIENKLNR